MPLDIGAIGSITPWGAIANAAAQVLGTPTSSSLTAGPVGSGPKVINVAGFGSRAEGSATQSLTSAEPDRGLAFPMSTIGDAGAVPAWVLPAAGALLALVLVVSLVKRRK